MDWIIQNAGTILVLLVLAAIVAAVLCGMRRNKKAGKSACGCGCSSCPMSGECSMRC